MMQNRKNVLAVFVLLLTLTLFFSTLPLYAAGVNGAGGTVTEGSSNGATNNGALEEAAGAARDAVDGVIDGAEDLLPENGADTTIPDQNTPTPEDGDNIPNGDDTTPDMGNEGTTGSGATLGDTDGDGVTEDSVAHGGFSWGWFLLILLAAVVVIVIIALCVPKRG